MFFAVLEAIFFLERQFHLTDNIKNVELSRRTLDRFLLARGFLYLIPNLYTFSFFTVFKISIAT